MGYLIAFKLSISLLFIAGVLNVIEEKPVGITDTVAEFFIPLMLTFFWILIMSIVGGLLYFIGWYWG